MTTRSSEDKVDWLIKNNAMLKGHFLLASGLHSEYYVQKTAIFEYPELCVEVAVDMVREHTEIAEAQTVVSLATGAIIWGHELARTLGIRHIFAERVGDAMVIKRNFQLAPGEKIIIAEDVVTTGGSIKELIPILEQKEVEIVAAVIVADRSSGRFSPSFPCHSWVQLSLPTYEPFECPLCKKDIPFYIPGTKQGQKKEVDES
jgi:orotate phosphoribosyltransferase